MAVHNLYLNAVNNYGNSKQKGEFIQPFTNGENVGSFSLSEPGIKKSHLIIMCYISTIILY